MFHKTSCLFLSVKSIMSDRSHPACQTACSTCTITPRGYSGSNDMVMYRIFNTRGPITVP